MNKPEHMKQNGPKDQQYAILGGLEGHIDNLREGHSTNIENMQRLIDDLKILLAYLPEKWENNSPGFFIQTGKSIKCPRCNSSMDVESTNTVQEIVCGNCRTVFLYSPRV